jgi:hypothetical protein
MSGNNAQQTRSDSAAFPSLAAIAPASFTLRTTADYWPNDELVISSATLHDPRAVEKRSGFESEPERIAPRRPAPGLSATGQAMCATGSLVVDAANASGIR